MQLPSENPSPPVSTAHGPAIGARVDRRCHLCGTQRLRVLPFRYAFLDRFLYGVRCESCSLVFVDPQPSPEEIVAMYAEEYFTESSETVGAHGPAAYMEMAEGGTADRGRAAADLDRELVRRLGGRGRYLEIGCGPGYFLAEVSRLGWEAEGLELSAYAARFAEQTLGLEVTHGTIEPGGFPHGSFDAIFLGDVLEHLAEPLRDLGTIRGWLRPGGVAVVAVPSTMNLISAQLGLAVFASARRFKTMRIPPYHLFEYTPSTLARMLRAAGFRVHQLRQSAVPLSRMGLRGSRIENGGKVALQVFAHATARLLNRGGDRLRAIVTRD